MTGSSPELPLLRPIFSILVAGHQDKRLAESSADLASVRASLEDVLAQAAAATTPAFAGGPYEKTGARIRVISGELDGIDAMTGELVRAAPSRYDLKLVTPLTTRYCGADRPHWLSAEAIELRDRIALAHADLVVAVWDGEAPQGFRGGTVRIVQWAALAGKMVVWINRHGTCHLLDRTMLTSAALVALRTLESDPAIMTSLFIPFDRARFATEIGEALLPSGVFATSRRDQDPAARRVRDYFRPALRLAPLDRRAGSIDRGLGALVTGNWGKLAGAARQLLWPKRTGPRTIRPPWPEGLPRPLAIERFFAFSARQAEIAAGRRRSNIWLMSLLAAAAVLLGALGPLAGHDARHWLAIAELGAVLLILALFAVHRLRGVHGRWLFHRWLAEQLRLHRMIIPLDGIHAIMLRGAGFVGSAAAAGPPPSRAQDWLLQRVLIAEDFDLSADVPAGGLAAYGAMASGLLQAGVADQKAYHRTNAGLLHRLHRNLDWLAVAAFVVTAAAVIGHLTLGLEWTFVATTFLPSLGAAFTAIAEQLETAPLAGQSRRMSDRLAAYGGALERAAARNPGAAPWQQVWKLLEQRRIGQEAVAAMAGETEDWRSILNYRDARLA